MYDEPYLGYVFTTAFVEKVVRETNTAETFKTFLGLAPKPRLDRVEVEI